jgi:hypothetical protein
LRLKIDTFYPTPLLSCLHLYNTTTTALFTMDLIEDIDLFDLIPTIILGVAEEARTMRTPRNTGQPGGVYLQELLGSSEKRIYSVLRMKRETFLELCNWLQIHTDLTPSRNISVQEQVAMFLWTINYSASNAVVAERFQHSGETVSR